jgi:group I intron endonuclease
MLRSKYQNQSYIYLITNTVNEKQYIGQTKDIKKRILNHLQGNGSKSFLCDVVNQQPNDFKFEVIEQIFDPEVNVDALEDTYISEYDCLHPKGYNMRVNHQIEVNGEHIDLNIIEIQGKFVFNKDDCKVFSIGEFTKSRSYQLLI